MKLKIILLLLIVFGITFSADAQSRKKGRKSYKKHGARGGRSQSAAGTVSYGPRVGATFATLDNNPFDESSNEEEISFEDTKLSYRTGLQVGAVVNVGITDFLSVQPEFLYVEKGTKASATLDRTDSDGPFTLKSDGKFDSELKATYYEMPLLLKASIGGNGVTGFITAGPTFGYWNKGESWTKGNLKMTMSYTDGTNTYSNTEESPMDESHKTDFNNDEDGRENRFETGASIGAGFGYRLGPGTLNLDVRYGMGLSSITDPRTEGERKYKNRVIGVSLAYLFGR